MISELPDAPSTKTLLFFPLLPGVELTIPPISPNCPDMNRPDQAVKPAYKIPPDSILSSV